MNISIKKLRDSAILPSYATAHAAGMDLSACIDEPMTIAPGERKLIPTGVVVAVPVGYEVQIRGRSGMAIKHGIMPANGMGTIDADYRGEMHAILLNNSDEPFVIEPGMRVAQMVVAKHETVQWQQVDELDETDRGANGFGSTGTI